MAWRRPARGWALAAAAASTLPALFILRAGADALADPSAIAVIAAAGLALVAWIVVPSRVKLRHAALALTVLAPAVLLASVVVVAMGMGPTCGELMAPPTASPSLR